MITPKRTILFQRIAAERQSGLVVVLEDIHDPHNAMAILRTCDAFGVQDIYFIFDKEPRYNPRRIGKSSSSSANKWLTYRIFRSSVECIDDLKKNNFLIYATALSVNARTLETVPVDGSNLAVVFGNEHRGISEKIAQHANALIQLPMYGFVQSLNVSVTAGIVLYDIVTRRRKTDSYFRLSDVDQQRLVDTFKSR